MGGTRAAAALLLAACLSWPVAAGAGTSQPSLLDVPYLPQSEQLCGGAAAAMVLRYWGGREIRAEDFASLLDPRMSGIRGDVLAGAVRERGWIAQSLRGDKWIARDHLAKGRPLIALVEDRPGRLHYVVLVGWPEGQVILHDPARAPFRVVAESAFSKAWAAAGFWTLLILPDPGRQALPAAQHLEFATAAAAAHALAGDGCRDLVGEGIRFAQAGDPASADVALSRAVAQCPGSALAARELAGLRFMQSRWPEAAGLAARAAAATPDDAHAWRLLASSRFIQDDADGALAAWNRIGEPQVDLVRVEGLDRTHYGIVQDLLDLPPRAELTPRALQRARRRLALLPGASATRVGYRPAPGGLADIDAAIVERPPVPDRMALAGMAADALIERELQVDLAAPAGSGSRLVLNWRWWDGRPRAGFSFLAPAAFGRSGLWRLDGLWEQQSYAVSGLVGEDVVRQSRQRLALSYADWAAADTRVALGAALDRWNQDRDHVSLFGSIERRLAEDRLAARARGAMWPALGRAPWFGTGGFDLSWRSSSSSAAMLLTARGGVQAASARAPLDVWPGADAGHARDVLARAHPLLAGGVVHGGILGRTLAHGGAELQAAAFARGPARVGVALFGDVARAWRPFASGSGARTQIDVGIGLRLRVAGHAPTLRIDVARGLRDGQSAVSAGWQLPWPEER